MNPYPGLRPFDEADQDVFFGREEEIDQLLYRLAERRLMAVVGVSGCGKSSLIRAGLIPVLRSGLADPLSGAWRILTLFPGTAPLEALNQALGTRLDNRSHALHEWAKIQNPSEKILLLVDQFEEIFSYRKDTMSLDGGNSAALFVDFLLTAAQDPGIPLYVVLTMRTDYLGDCPVFRGLAEALNDGQYLVPRLTRLHLQDAIERPAEFCTVTPQPALVQRLLTDSTEDADKLPVLQHLLKRLWEERNGGPLDLALYKNDKVGGWKHALERDAEAVLMRFPEEQEGVRRLFQALTDKGTGDKPVRRKQPMAKLSAVTGITVGRLEKIVKSFADRDFLRLEGTSLNVVVELMHESVMWQWPKLKDWIDQEATLAKSLEFLKDSADKQQSVTGSALAQALDLREQGRLDGLWPRRYLSESELDAVKKWIEESEQREEAEKKRSQKELRQARRLLAIVGTAALICLIAGIVAFIFYRRAEGAKTTAEQKTGEAEQQKREADTSNAKAQKAQGIAEEQKGLADKALKKADKNASFAQAEQQEAKARELAAYGLESLSDDPERSVILGMYAVDATMGSKPTVVPAAEDVLHRAILSSAVQTLFESHPVVSVAFSPDSKRLAIAGDGETVNLLDITNQNHLLPVLRGHWGFVNVTFSPDGTRLASASSDNAVKLWDAVSLRELLTLHGHSGLINNIAFSPDGKHLASASDDETVRFWDVATGQEVKSLAPATNQELLPLQVHSGAIAVVFSPDGSRLATVSKDAIVELWDVATWKELLSFRGHLGDIYGAAFSPDGARLATAGADHTVKLWDTRSGKELLTLRGHSGSVRSLAFSPNGKHLATASADHTVKLWDVAKGEELLTLRGHSGEIYSVAFSPDGNQLASASKDKTVKLWDATGAQELLTSHGDPHATTNVAFSPNSKRLAIAGADLVLWDTSSGKKLLTLPGHLTGAYSMAFSPDGKHLATANADHTVKLWDATSGREFPSWERGHSDIVTSMSFSPDTKQLAAARDDHTVTLWNAFTGDELRTLPAQSDDVTTLAFSRDGNLLAVASADGGVTLWDMLGRPVSFKNESRHMDNLKTESGVLKTESGAISSVAFSPDGLRLATVGSDKTLKLWDRFTGQQLPALLDQPAEVTSVVFSADGKRLATAGADRTVKLWDATNGRELLTLHGCLDAVLKAIFSPDGRRLATICADGTVELYILDAKELLQLAKKRVGGRALNEQECKHYFPNETCPSLP